MKVQLVSPRTEDKDMNLSQDLAQVVADFKPYVIKDVVCLSPGIWNDRHFSKETIIEGFNATDWSDKKNYELIYDHDDKNASSWVGNLINRKVDDKGIVSGDLEIYDKDLAIKLGKAKAKLGVSAGMRGLDDGRNYFIGSFRNFSIVSDPACQEAFINLSEGSEIEHISKEETKGDDKQNKMEEDKVSTGLDSTEKLSSRFDQLASKLESYESKVSDLTEKLKAKDANLSEPVKEEPVKEEPTPVQAPQPVAAPVAAQPIVQAAPAVDNKMAEEMEDLKAQLAAMKVQQAIPKEAEVVADVKKAPGRSNVFDKKDDLDRLIAGRIDRLI